MGEAIDRGGGWNIQPPVQLFFAMADPGAHPTFFPTDLAAAFTCLLRTHLNRSPNGETRPESLT